MTRYMLILCLLFSLSTHGQIRDKHWVMGNPVHLFSFDESVIERTQAILHATSIQPGFSNGTSCISDEKGEIALLCNGFFLFDTAGVVIENGDSLVPSKLIIDQNGFSSYTQHSIILPKKDNQYYVFTPSASDKALDEANNGQPFRFDQLTYHIVEAFGGGTAKGKVLEKKKFLMKDVWLSHNRMTAVKHANGRDWWLVKPHRKQQIFYTFLVTPDSIFGPFSQDLNKPEIEHPGDLQAVSVFGASSFSRDGRFYAHTVGAAGVVFVNEFDRCTGKFTDYATYDIPATNDTMLVQDDLTHGVAFSSDSKLLYVNTYARVYQIELANKTDNSVQFIHGPDTTASLYFAGYLYMALGSDNRIYLGTLQKSQNAMSYIENPNVRGTGCNFCRRCLTNGISLGSPPNMPYYALGALEGSGCDTLGYTNAVSELVLPNSFTPNGDGLNDVWRVVNKNSLLYKDVTIEECGIYNRWGNMVFTGRGMDFEWNGGDHAMDTYYYFVRYRLANGEVKVKKGDINLIR